MDVFTMVVVIVAMSIFGGVIMKYLETRGEVSGDEAADASEFVREIDDLRSRVETLETIVTDEKYQLQRKIDEL